MQTFPRRRPILLAAVLGALVLALGVSVYTRMAAAPHHAATSPSAGAVATGSTTAGGAGHKGRRSAQIRPAFPPTPIHYYHLRRRAALRFGPRARPVAGVVLPAGLTVRRWGPQPSTQWINVTIAAMNGYLPAADLAPIYAREQVK